jgi:hypothetical protein
VDAALIAPIATESPRIIRSLWTSSEWLGVGRSDGIGIDGSVGMGSAGMGSVGIWSVDRTLDLRRRRPGVVGIGRRQPVVLRDGPITTTCSLPVLPRQPSAEV